jgi:hypothetical protein
MNVVGRAVAVFLASLCVLFPAMAHVVKYVVQADARYHHLEALRQVSSKIVADDVVFFGDDRFAMLFLDRLSTTYADRGDARAYWVFPYFVGSRELEDETVRAFVCKARKLGGASLVWAASEEFLESFDADERIAVVWAGYWTRMHVRLAIDDVMYRRENVVIFRGRINRITWDRRHVGSPEPETIYAIDSDISDCVRAKPGIRRLADEKSPT